MITCAVTARCASSSDGFTYEDDALGVVRKSSSSCVGVHLGSGVDYRWR